QPQRRWIEAADRDAAFVGDRLGQRCSFEADEIDIHAVRRERASVIQHPGATPEIAKRNDDGSHVGSGRWGVRELYYARRSSSRASRFAATRRRYSAVERMSSIGAISSPSVRWASATDAPRASAASVRTARTTVGATLPS